MRKILYLCVLLSQVYAANAFFERSEDGYFYYKDTPIKKKSEKKSNSTEPEKTVSIKDYNSTETKMAIPFETKEQRAERREREAEYMSNVPWDDLDNLSADEYRRLLDTTREISVATPTKQYVKTYAALQKFWIDKSERYSKVWKVANLENPDELIYPSVETTSFGRQKHYDHKKDDDKKWFKKMSSKMGYIVILQDKGDPKTFNDIKYMYDSIKKETGLDYKIYDYYEVPTLVRRLKLSLNTLPDTFILYRGIHDKQVFKRVAKGYSSVDNIIKNTKFVFENAILEKDKQMEDRLNNN